MTTKEFQRRCMFYADLNVAAFYFSSELIDNIYRVSYSIDGQSIFMFCLDPCKYFFSCYDSDVRYDYIYFDVFTLSDFHIQLKYFKSFLSRLSKNQFDKIHSDSRFFNLFKFIENEQSCSIPAK